MVLTLRLLRLQRALPLRIIAAKIKISAMALSNLERGVFRPTTKHAKSLERFYKMPLEVLLKPTEVYANGKFI